APASRPPFLHIPYVRRAKKVGNQTPPDALVGRDVIEGECSAMTAAFSRPCHIGSGGRLLVGTPDRTAASLAAASDEILIVRIARGDQLAMRALFARHQVPVYRFLIRIVRDATLAEDILSETFLAVWRQAGEFEARSSVATWLLSIARFK